MSYQELGEEKKAMTKPKSNQEERQARSACFFSLGRVGGDLKRRRKGRCEKGRKTAEMY